MHFTAILAIIAPLAAAIAEPEAAPVAMPNTDAITHPIALEREVGGDTATVPDLAVRESPTGGELVARACTSNGCQCKKGLPQVSVGRELFGVTCCFN